MRAIVELSSEVTAHHFLSLSKYGLNLETLCAIIVAKRFELGNFVSHSVKSVIIGGECRALSMRRVP